jgi:hypothetical protein
LEKELSKAMKNSTLLQSKLYGAFAQSKTDDLICKNKSL